LLHLRVDIPVHDGTTLRGLRYAPSVEPAPTILVVTPYGADHYHPDGVYFASRGFNFVSVDCRGRGDSDGEFVPFANDAADGNALVNRLAEHPWSNGEIVTYGGSYSGFNQWATAATHPEPLRAIAPVAAVYPGRDFPIVNNVPLAYAARWLTYVNGRRRNEGPFKDEPFWLKAPRDLIKANRPHRDLDLRTTGGRLPVFQEWLNHPHPDDYWQSMVPTPDQLAALTLPVLTITGQYDDDQLGALTHYLAAPPHDLVIGPWDHGGTRTGAVSFGGLTFHESAGIDLKALHADWFNWALGKGDRPEFLADRVTYFHIGENRWRTTKTLPAAEDSLDLHLAAANTLTPTTPTLTTLTPTTLTLPIDPHKALTRPEQFEPEAFVFPISDLATHPESLLHQTNPLPNPVDITGTPTVQLTLSADIPDFDLLVSIYLLSGETATKLGEHPFRARYHDNPTVPTPWPTTPTNSTPTDQAATPPQIPVTLPDFPFISLRTEPGDRIALLIVPPDLRFAPNFQLGGDPVDELPSQAKAGTVQIHQNPDYPSCLRLPLDR
jgi:hypothetical protein